MVCAEEDDGGDLTRGSRLSAREEATGLWWARCAREGRGKKWVGPTGGAGSALPLFFDKAFSLFQKQNKHNLLNKTSKEFKPVSKIVYKQNTTS